MGVDLLLDAIGLYGGAEVGFAFLLCELLLRQTVGGPFLIEALLAGLELDPAHQPHQKYGRQAGDKGLQEDHPKDKRQPRQFVKPGAIQAQVQPFGADQLEIALRLTDAEDDPEDNSDDGRQDTQRAHPFVALLKLYDFAPVRVVSDRSDLLFAGGRAVRDLRLVAPEGLHLPVQGEDPVFRVADRFQIIP